MSGLSHTVVEVKKGWSEIRKMWSVTQESWKMSGLSIKQKYSMVCYLGGLMKGGGGYVI